MTENKKNRIDPTRPLELDDGTPVTLHYPYYEGEENVGVNIGTHSPRRGGASYHNEDWFFYRISDGTFFGGGADEYYTIRNRVKVENAAPEWAYKRADEISDLKNIDAEKESGVCRIRDAFAAYIAHHEDPPVDPVEEMLVDAVGGKFAAGWYKDFLSNFRAALAKHGLEIVEKKS